MEGANPYLDVTIPYKQALEARSERICRGVSIVIRGAIILRLVFRDGKGNRRLHPAMVHAVLQILLLAFIYYRGQSRHKHLWKRGKES